MTGKITNEMTNTTTSKQFKRVAIANRGEVAVRIIRACRELGIETVLLHSEPDRATDAFRMSDHQVCIGAAPSSESYLNIAANVNGALAAGADAIHPGFGFLSENADFAKACTDRGIVFIGPSSEAISSLGDKTSAKKIVEKAGVPLVPGYMGEDQSIERLVNEAVNIGFPVIAKAAAGGGGRGLKIIENKDQAREQIEAAQREGLSAFGSDVVFLEKYLNRAKHIEFQVFGDCAGNVFHLFDRECSVQRRHQKIIEEAISASISPELRETMGEAAKAVAQAVKYKGAGTVEFLVQDDHFYFLEMNTRLQVEHTVTEEVVGVDLVKAQIMTAQDEPVNWRQDELRPVGHSIECRIYAEDPYNMGVPSTGLIGHCHWPVGPGRRFETGFSAGDELTSFYDSMIAKVIVWDETRERAIEKMQAVLNETVIFGVKTNIPFLKKIMAHPEFLASTMTTQFIGQHFPEALESKPDDEELLELAGRLRSAGASSGFFSGASASGQQVSDSVNSPWQSHWRLV